jgi:hypothetical protein
MGRGDGKGDIHLLSTEDETLLHWWNAFFFLDFLLDLRYLRRGTCQQAAAHRLWREEIYTRYSGSMSSSISFPVNVLTLWKQSAPCLKLKGLGLLDQHLWFL